MADGPWFQCEGQGPRVDSFDYWFDSRANVALVHEIGQFAFGPLPVGRCRAVERV